MGILIAVFVFPTAPAEYYLRKTRVILADWHRTLSPELNQQMEELARRGLAWNPHNPELYAALQEHLKHDDERLVQALQQASGDPDDVLAGVAHALQSLPLAGSCFALKGTVAKRYLKKSVPKKAMKQLGYRSFDSMLKH